MTPFCHRLIHVIGSTIKNLMTHLRILIFAFQFDGDSELNHNHQCGYTTFCFLFPDGRARPTGALALELPSLEPRYNDTAPDSSSVNVLIMHKWVDYGSIWINKGGAGFRVRWLCAELWMEDGSWRQGDLGCSADGSQPLFRHAHIRTLIVLYWSVYFYDFLHLRVRE